MAETAFMKDFGTLRGRRKRRRTKGMPVKKMSKLRRRRKTLAEGE